MVIAQRRLKIRKLSMQEEEEKGEGKTGGGEVTGKGIREKGGAQGRDEG